MPTRENFDEVEFERKTKINMLAQARYDELMREGKHGHYETMFRVIHECIDIDRFAAQRGAEAELTIRQGRPRNKLTIYEPPQTGGGDELRAVSVSTVLENDALPLEYKLKEGRAGRQANPSDFVNAPLVGQADTSDLKSDAERRGGSNPSGGTITQTGGGDAGERARVHPDQQARFAFYEAFRAWFMQSGCDFWSECDAPESLATIAVEIQEAALRSSHRESAEAMREAAAQVADRHGHQHHYHEPDETVEHRAEQMTAAAFISAQIRALPIPGSKTDAG